MALRNLRQFPSRMSWITGCSSPSSRAEPGGVPGDGSPWWSTSFAGPASTTRSPGGYVKRGCTVRVDVGMFDRKTWRRNTKTELPVRPRLAAQDYDMNAHVVSERHRVNVLTELNAEVS